MSKDLSSVRIAGNPERFQSASVRRLLDRARRFARDQHATLLIEGETGTGKTLLARHLHALSPRASKPYHTVVMSTVDDALAASELFGHVAGAYTDARQSRAGHFVLANGGTLFLDEIGKATLGVQQRLLHAVEYGEFRPIGADRDAKVDVRIIAASNLPLSQQVAADRFLPDLYARLSVFTLTMPRLRDVARISRCSSAKRWQCIRVRPAIRWHRLSMGRCSTRCAPRRGLTIFGSSMQQCIVSSSKRTAIAC